MGLAELDLKIRDLQNLYVTHELWELAATDPEAMRIAALHPEAIELAALFDKL